MDFSRALREEAENRETPKMAHSYGKVKKVVETKLRPLVEEMVEIVNRTKSTLSPVQRRSFSNSLQAIIENKKNIQAVSARNRVDVRDNPPATYRSGYTDPERSGGGMDWNSY